MNKSGGWGEEGFFTFLINISILLCIYAFYMVCLSPVWLERFCICTEWWRGRTDPEKPCPGAAALKTDRTAWTGSLEGDGREITENVPGSTKDAGEFWPQSRADSRVSVLLHTVSLIQAAEGLSAAHHNLPVQLSGSYIWVSVSSSVRKGEGRGSAMGNVAYLGKAGREGAVLVHFSSSAPSVAVASSPQLPE